MPTVASARTTAVIRLCLQVLEEHRLASTARTIHPLRVMPLPAPKQPV